MTAKDRKQRAEELRTFSGEFVELSLKTTSMAEAVNQDITMVSNITIGYVIEVSDFYLFLGETPEGFNSAIEIEEISRIQMIDNVPEELKTFIGDDDSVH